MMTKNDLFKCFVEVISSLHKKFCGCLSLAITVAFLACTNDFEKKAGNRLFEPLATSHSGIHFRNEIKEDTVTNIANFAYMYNGGGVAIGDVDNDGLEDIYFTGNQSSGKLYLNKGDLTFEDVTQKAGLVTNRWCTGVGMVDINADGWLDIYISATQIGDGRSGRNLFFINQGRDESGQVHFIDCAKDLELDDPGFTVQAAFFDYDGDDDLDVFLLRNHLENFPQNTIRPKLIDGSGKSNDKLFRNNGIKNGKLPSFTEVTKEAGILKEGYGLGIAVSDLNKDGFPDIYISNDFLSDDQLYINRGNGTFVDLAPSLTKHQSRHGMGVEVADYNNDSNPDILVMDMLPWDNGRKKQMAGQLTQEYHENSIQEGYLHQYIRNTLQLHNGIESDDLLPFSEIGQLAGIATTDWSWSPLMADFDNDGLKDVFITNGLPHNITDLDYVNYGYHESLAGNMDNKHKTLQTIQELPPIMVPNMAFLNQGNLTFKDVTDEWGFEEPIISNGAAYADLDQDGDLDVVVNSLNQTAKVYKNLSSEKNYLQIELKGGPTNPMAVGAKLVLKARSKTQYIENFPQRAYQSSIGFRHHFGLGKDTLVDTLKVIWPDGSITLKSNLRSNQHLTVKWSPKGTFKENAGSDKPSGVHLISSIAGGLIPKHTHLAFEANDFGYERLLPWKYSLGGPGMAIADINGDGTEDLFIGADRNSVRYLHIQGDSGKFIRKPLTENAMPEPGTDMGVLFFDYDSDGDNDLYIVRGGNSAPAGDPIYTDQLFENDGSGNFRLTSNVIPTLHDSGSSVSAADFDQDGDLDLFIGSKLVPKQFPLIPQSRILLNEGGKFSDASHLLPDSGRIGLVSQGLWSDVDNDGKMDLITVGHMMPVRIFMNRENRFEEFVQPNGLSNQYGMWNSIIGGDFDNDGDTDYVVGNMGKNNYFHPNGKNPVEWIVKDFDGNGTIDPIMSYYSEGIRVPMPSRDKLLSQIPKMRKRFPDYASYAHATMDQVLTAKEKKNAKHFLINYDAHVYLENKGNTLIHHPLPIETQFSSVFGMVAKDLNNDGYLDLSLIGNDSSPEVQIGKSDALSGLVLLGNGKSAFEPIQDLTGRFTVDGDGRALCLLSSQTGKQLLLASQNNGNLLGFELKSNQDQIAIGPETIAIILKLDNGQIRKHELYNGQGYLSQESRKVFLPAYAKIHKKINYVQKE